MGEIKIIALNHRQLAQFCIAQHGGVPSRPALPTVEPRSLGHQSDLRPDLRLIQPEGGGPRRPRARRASSDRYQAGPGMPPRCTGLEGAQLSPIRVPWCSRTHSLRGPSIKAGGAWCQATPSLGRTAWRHRPSMRAHHRRRLALGGWGSAAAPFAGTRHIQLGSCGTDQDGSRSEISADPISGGRREAPGERPCRCQCARTHSRGPCLAELYSDGFSSGAPRKPGDRRRAPSASLRGAW